MGILTLTHGNIFPNGLPQVGKYRITVTVVVSSVVKFSSLSWEWSVTSKVVELELEGLEVLTLFM